MMYDRNAWITYEMMQENLFGNLLKINEFGTIK